MFLSIIFPAFEEEKKIESDINRAKNFLLENSIEGEIIIVDDGSKDKTSAIAKSLITKIKVPLKVLILDNQRGKGAAVKEGVNAAKGEFIVYSDVGNIVPFNFALKGIEILKTKADIANASRKLADSIIVKKQKTDREIASRLFNWLIYNFLYIPNYLTDTQCGFKVYKNNVAKKLFSELQVNGFLFEIEIILRAVNYNYKIVEFPVEWKCDRDSRISFRKTSYEVIKEFFVIKKLFN